MKKTSKIKKSVKVKKEGKKKVKSAPEDKDRERVMKQLSALGYI